VKKAPQMNRPKSRLFAILLAALYLLHQDFWFWASPKPLLFGFLPPALWYHAGLSIAAAIVMWFLVRMAWPSHLEDPGKEHSAS
jgi:hypothetical protein